MYLKVEQAVSAIEYSTFGIRIIAITIDAIIMFCGPINISPFSGPDVLPLDFHEYSIGNHWARWTAPVVVRGINELDIVITRPAIDENKGGIVLKGVIRDICSR